MKRRMIRFVFLGISVVGLAAMLMLPQFFNPAIASSRQQQDETMRTGRTKSLGYDNYDIRLDDTKEAHVTLENYEREQIQRRAQDGDQFLRTRRQSEPDAGGVLQSMAEAETKLASRLPGLTVKYSEVLSAPEIVEVQNAEGRALAVASTEERDKSLRRFLGENAALYGLNSRDVSRLRTTADYVNPAENLSWLCLQQEINSVPVFQGGLTGAFTRDGRLIRVVSTMAPGVSSESVSSTPAISAADAVIAGADSIGVAVSAADLIPRSSASDNGEVVFEPGPFADETKVSLTYFPTKPEVAVLAWSMVLWQDVPAYYIIVDAETGQLLWRKNITNDQTQTATYSVYDSDSPGPLSPTNALPGSGIQGPGVPRTTFTLISELPAFDNLGWITDGGNTTTGNNVDAGLDLVAPNGIDPGGRPTGAPLRVFDFPYNPPPLGADAPTGANYRFGVVTNLFFWSNRYHDRLYQFGFTEPARNFQQNNFGRGGLGNDFVRAEAQDSSGTNNANFATPADGSLPRMQMFIFTGPNPDRDGDLDADVFLHELTHGTSNRLHNNAAGLTGTQAGGMGEGWSDFYARVLLSTADEDVNAIYAAGAYVTLNLGALGTNNYYYGIRRFPYAVKTNLGANGKPHNPLTFADIDPAQINTTDGAFPRSPAIGNTANEVHNIGEVWCMALLEVRARIITRLGFATGNPRMLQITTDGMKLDPISPTLLDGRNSILAADCAGFGGADEMDIWSGFATRGMGFSAKATNTSSAVTEAFDMPNLTLGSVTLSDAGSCNPGVADPNEDIILNVPLINPFCSTGATSVTASIAGGGSAVYGTIPGGGSVTMSIPFHVPASTPCGALLTMTVNINSSLGAVTRTFPLQIGKPVVAFFESFDTVTAPALPAGWTAQPVIGAACGSGTTAPWKTVTTTPDTAPNAAFSPDPNCVNDIRLDSPSIAITTSQASVTFRNNYNLESSFDGGVLEISIGGGPFSDIVTAGGSFVTGGYNMTISANFQNPIAGRRAWSGNSGGYLTTAASLPASAAGQSVVLRWRMGSDNIVAGTGWRIDTISVNDGFTCCCIITCPSNIARSTDPGACGALVNYPAPTAGACGAVTCTPPSGSFFPTGVTTVTCTAATGTSCSFSVTIQDTEAPTVSCSVGDSELWPPNHNLINVALAVTANDNCGASVLVQVFSNEDDEGETGDGNFSPDAKDVAAGTLRLRAERSGGGNGRVYLIIVTATDPSGNVSRCCKTVTVAHSNSGASREEVASQAAAAEAFCQQNGGPPPGYFIIGDGPVIGPKQ